MGGRRTMQWVKGGSLLLPLVWVFIAYYEHTHDGIVASTWALAAQMVVCLIIIWSTPTPEA